VILMDGCVQSVAEPNINAATARVLNRLGVGAVRASGVNCCGAVSFHLSAADEARTFMRANIDAWWPLIEQGAEAIVITSSACSLMVKDYGRVLHDDAAYADKAARISALCCDVSEFIARADLGKLTGIAPRQIAFHAPCTLQHGGKLPGVVEQILGTLGFTLTPVKDAHLCCGAAGTYSILQPELSKQLLANKVVALEGGEPDTIATANIGCLLHLQGGSRRPVQHWIELLDEPAP
jgi:glycolate oxidase iron-sulfur subunit